MSQSESQLSRVPETPRTQRITEEVPDSGFISRGALSPFEKVSVTPFASKLKTATVRNISPELTQQQYPDRQPDSMVLPSLQVVESVSIDENYDSKQRSKASPLKQPYPSPPRAAEGSGAAENEDYGEQSEIASSQWWENDNLHSTQTSNLRQQNDKTITQESIYYDALDQELECGEGDNEEEIDIIPDTDFEDDESQSTEESKFLEQMWQQYPKSKALLERPPPLPSFRP